MPATLEDVKYIAALAKLDFTDEELGEFTRQFNEILNYIDLLNEADTSGVEPLSHPVEGKIVLRTDATEPGSTSEAALKNAPETDGVFFLVPRTINPDKKS